MDSITHTVLGACIGEIVAGKKIGKHAMFWGALANNIPDIDVITSAWMNQADSLLAHRGFTHSIVFAIVFPIILSFPMRLFYKNRKIHFNDWILIFGSGMFIHIFIDSLTCYGTGLFEPFSHERVSFNVLFVADPLYTIAPILSFIILIIMKKGKILREKLAYCAVVISSAYILFAFTIKLKINSEFITSLEHNNIHYKNYFTTPAPLNCLLWYVVAKDNGGYYTGYRSVFDTSITIPLNHLKQNEYLLSSIESDESLSKLKRFSKGYYTIQIKDSLLFFNDIRFGTVGGWKNPDEDFVFRYGLNKDANNDLVIQRGRMKSSGKDAIKSLWERIKGD